MTRLLMVLFVVLLLAVMVVGWGVGPALEGRFIPGVWVWTLPLNGVLLGDAPRYLETGLPLAQPNLVLIGPDGRRWSFSPSDLGVTLQVSETVAQAYAVGHQGAEVERLRERFDVMTKGVRLSPVLVWNPVVAETRLQAIAAELERPAQDARVGYAQGQLALEPGSVGLRMEVTATLAALRPALFALEPLELVIPVKELRPQISDEAVEQALAIAHTILAEPLMLVLPNPREGDPGPWQLPPDVLSQMLVVRVAPEGVWVGLDEHALAEYLAPLEMALVLEPKDARFHFDVTTKQLVPITDGYHGRQLNVAASVKQINDLLQVGQHVIALAMDEKPTRFPADADAATIGIRELVAVGESYFTGSSSARDKNIRLGASKFDGLMIAPGQIFSFNEYLGKVTAEEGYDESYVIIGDRTVPGVGGGICQVATTVFRAAFFGGYRIVERWPHAYRVGYYELGGFGPGFDATIYTPLLDFRFENDSPYPLLIQTTVDAGRARLQFLFYSTPLSRTVEQIGPKAGESVPPGPEIYEFDPTLPAGTYRQIETAHAGLRATLGRIVKDGDGKVLYEDTFVSNFIPWSARYRYGPGFTPPEGAQIITPEPTETPTPTPAP